MTQPLLFNDFFLPISSLDAFIARAMAIPLLTHDEEVTLATRLREHNDLEAARSLILSHLRFVIRIAKGYTGYGLPLADLIQEGNIGLMKAVKRFDPKVGVRLVSFAVHWIKAEIHEYVLRNWRIVKIATTKAQRKLFFKLRNAKKHLSWFTNDEIEAVAQDLNVKPETVRQMEMRLYAHDTAFDGHSDDDSDDHLAFVPAAMLSDTQHGPENALENSDWKDQHYHALQTALQTLDVRSQEILRERWLSGNKTTLHDLARKYHVSAERIRQIEKMAMEKIKGIILKMV